MWIPLHVHSQYSILDASASLQGIIKKAKEFHLPSCSLTDHGNLHGAIDFYKGCHKEGIKPIIGCEVYVAPTSRMEKKKGGPSNRVAYHLVLLVKDEEGYRNLCHLSSLGYLEGFYYHPRIDKDLLKQHAKGLICLSACLSGTVAQTALHGSLAELGEEIKWHHDLFGNDYYLELQRHTMSREKLHSFTESWLIQHYEEYIKKEERVNSLLLEMGKKLGIKCVATNDSHYLEPSDWEAHEILLNISSGEPCEIWEKDAHGNQRFKVPNPKRRVFPTRENYFKSPAEMIALFSDCPEVVANTLEVAEKCHLTLDLTTKHYPVYIPSTLQDKNFTQEERTVEVEGFLRRLCEEGIAKRYTPDKLAKVKEKYPDKDPLEVVKARLEGELATITSKGMCDYLLIVWDFVNWAKKNKIPVGPGRGSGAGSIVLYLIEVTDIEPLRFSLFFERFINPERLSYPDIDVDICMERREEVIDYTVSRYGKGNVAQIITFGTMKAKMSIKDIGRVLSVPLFKVNQIAKLIPEDLSMTLDKALEIDADLHKIYTSDEETKRVIDLGKLLEGSIRNTGIHAAGMIVSGEALIDRIPLCLAKESPIPASQYSMKPLEMVGMLKIDFLGLTTLTSIQHAVDAIKAARGIDIDWMNLPLEDPEAFRLIQEGKTLGVFQIEWGGMRDLSMKLHPDRFEEIIAIVALYRPGPMEMIPSYINRKHGKEEIEYDHPWLQEILSETYGIAVYQEQVMQIAQKLASYTLAEGDVLRKAMGKKELAEMAKERRKFIQGAIKNGIDETTATAIFDRMEKFASYGFNKSHAAAYAYLTYVTAYLKAHYPKEWMAALMTCVRHDISKISKFIRECQSLDIPILSPDVNEARSEFTATEHGIRFAFGGIKGVGEGVVEAIVEERTKRGPYKDFHDFIKRIDPKRITKKAIETLVDAGTFDSTGWRRDELKVSIEEMFESVVSEKKDEERGVLTLFSLMGGEEKKRFTTPPPVPTPTSKLQILKREKELLGFFLTGHPMESYQELIKQLGCLPLCEIEKLENRGVARAAFIIESLEVKMMQKEQRKFAILQISDGLESYELPIWPDLYEEKQALLEENSLLFALVQVDKRDDPTRFSSLFLEDLSKMDAAMAQVADRAYDRAKSRNAKGEVRKKEPLPQEEIYVFACDANTTRLSHILKLKTLISKEFKGKRPCRLKFYSKQTLIATVDLHLRYSLHPTPTFEEQAKSLGFRKE